MTNTNENSKNFTLLTEEEFKGITSDEEYVKYLENLKVLKEENIKADLLDDNEKLEEHELKFKECYHKVEGDDWRKKLTSDDIEKIGRFIPRMTKRANDKKERLKVLGFLNNLINFFSTFPKEDFEDVILDALSGFLDEWKEFKKENLESIVDNLKPSNLTIASFFKWFKDDFPDEYDEYQTYRQKLKRKERAKEKKLNGVEKLSELLGEDITENCIDVIYTKKCLEVFKNKVIAIENSVLFYDDENGMWTKKEYEIMRMVQDKQKDIFINFDSDKPKDSFKNYFNMIYPKMLLAMAPRDDEFFINGDASRDYLLFKNGVLNFQTKELLPFNPKYRFTKRIKRELGERNDEKIQEVEELIFDKPFTKMEKKDYFLKKLARAIAGHYEDKNFLVVLGETDSGKGVLTKLLELSIDEFYSEFNGEELRYNPRSGNDSPKDLAFVCGIYDARIAVSNEMDMGNTSANTETKLNGNKIKKISGGGDRLRIRDQYEKPYTVVNKSTLLCFLNDILEISPPDKAIVNRGEYITMDRSSKVGLEEDNEEFFKADPFIKEKYIVQKDVLDAFIWLMIDKFEDSKPPRPDFVLSETKARSGHQDDGKEFLAENFVLYENDYEEKLEKWRLWKEDDDKKPLDYKKFLASLKKADGNYCSNLVKESKFYMPVSQIGAIYHQKGRGKSATALGILLNKLGYPSIKLKINGVAVNCRIGIKMPQKEEEDPLGGL